MENLTVKEIDLLLSSLDAKRAHQRRTLQEIELVEKTLVSNSGIPGISKEVLPDVLNEIAKRKAEVGDTKEHELEINILKGKLSLLRIERESDEALVNSNLPEELR